MIIVLMGVSGSGKTRVGRELAETLGWEFIEGDDFHPAANKEKMARGVPLTDADRDPWLRALGEAIRERVKANRNAVLASSALKESYRRRLRVDPAVRFVYLKGSRDQIAERLRRRRGHFFAPELLDSQFAALEEPRNALVVDISQTPGAIVRQITKELRPAVMK